METSGIDGSLNWHKKLKDEVYIKQKQGML